MSGDIVPDPGAVLKLVAAFSDSRVGMAGGRPSPRRDQGFMSGVVALQWDVHHRIALEEPKLGEAVAFRNVVASIPVDTAVDEAAIEAVVREQGLKLVYVPDAIIRNKGPETVGDFLMQRRRIAAGHHHLRATSGYQVSTHGGLRILKHTARTVLASPGRLPHAMLAAALEVVGRALGLFDLHIRKKNPYIWDVAASTKDLAGDGGGTP
jgi:biofilm PGA synthesis N-glycosyltransferase PgaC